MNMPLETFNALQMFQGLTNEDATAIRGTLHTLKYEPDSTILNEGESVQALWIILNGECTVSRSCNDPDVPADRILAVLAAGDVFGEMSFVRSAPHSASIKAVSDVTVCTYRRQDYLQLAQERPQAAWQIASNISAVLAERLRRMDTWVCDLFERPDRIDHRDEWKSFRSAVYTNWDF